MKIESISPTRSPQGRWKLTFDGGKELMVYPSLIGDLGLYEGMELSETELEALLERSAETSARERALRIISATSVTEKELLHRLLSKGEEESHARQAVEWLRELKLLDDRKVAEQIVCSGASRGYGAARIRQMLYEKRVPRELWEEALATMPRQEGQIEAFLQKRFHGKQPDRTECKRATDALLRRGHTWGDIRRAMEQYCAMDDCFED